MSYDIYATHAPLLALALSRTVGPVLELGTGYGSTPLIHALTRGRFVLSLDSDKAWLEKFHRLAVPRHQFRHVSDWPSCRMIEDEVDRWSVALVDCAPGEARTPLIARLADRCDIVVAHDSEKDYASGADYKYEKVTGLFKFVSEYRFLRPYTLALSNTAQIDLSEGEEWWVPSPEQQKYFDENGIKE
jgi:hypothetical protein